MNELIEETPSEWVRIQRRFRRLGIVCLLLVIVGVPFWFRPYDDLLDQFGTPLGGDFVMLYVAGRVVAEGQELWLYDDEANMQRSAELLPGLEQNTYWPFRYPPTVAICMAPLALLPFPMSYAVFVGLQCVLLAIGVAFLRRDHNCLQGASQADWLFAIVGSPVVLAVFRGGQSSFLALAIAGAAIFFLRRERLVAAGMVLAMGFYKPNVLLLFSFGCVVFRPAVLWGLVPTIVAGCLATTAFVGVEGLESYIELGRHLATSAWALETPFEKVHGLAPWLQLLTDRARGITFVLGLFAASLFGSRLRARRICLRLGLSVLLLINSLLNPYVPIYDLVLLIPVVLLVADEMREGTIPRLTAAAFQATLLVLLFGPHLSQLLAPHLGFQWFPLVPLAALVWCLWISRRSSGVATEIPGG